MQYTTKRRVESEGPYTLFGESWAIQVENLRGPVVQPFGFVQSTQPVYAYIYIWWFPEIGVPPNHPFLDGIFPYKPSLNHPAIGVPPIYGNPHME